MILLIFLLWQLGPGRRRRSLRSVPKKEKHPKASALGCILLVPEAGVDSRRELRALVGCGRNSPLDCCSVPQLLQPPLQLFQKGKTPESGCFQVHTAGAGSGGRLAARTARLGRPRSRQSTGLSLCTAPTSIPLSPFCKRTNKKEVPAFLQVLLSGGDEGDRTPYLLNAIQALSRITRKRPPMKSCLFRQNEYEFTLIIVQ